MSRLFVGGCKNGKREIFRSRETPTERTHGHKFGYVIGPFRTRAGAEIMASANGSPLIQTVSDAERIAANRRN